jgi:transposase-like protein
MKRKLEEQVVQEFPYRCPYCDREVSYEKIKLKVGENEIECPSCKKKYIKLVAPSLTEGDHGSRRQ